MFKSVWSGRLNKVHLIFDFLIFYWKAFYGAGPILKGTLFGVAASSQRVGVVFDCEQCAWKDTKWPVCLS